MLEPVTPLHWRSARQSDCTVQIFKHWGAPPEIESHTDWSGQPLVDPAVVQLLVQ